MQRRGEQLWKTQRAQALRSRQVEAEDLIWRELRNRRLGGYKFVRQVAIGSYFADFLCREFKVVVEIDGATHSEADEVAHDAQRTAFFEAHSYRMMRVSNDEVCTNMAGVLRTITSVLDELSGCGPEGGRV